MTRIITTVFGVGYLKPAPGTWGSLVAVLGALALHYIGGFPLLALATIVIFFIGWWATTQETRGKADHDPSEIVVDEMAGQWLALWVTSFGAWHAGLDPLTLYPGWIAGFVLFRLFDIIKPNLIGKADARSDALGVMLDDMIAGLYAAITTGVAAYVFHSMLAL